MKYQSKISCSVPNSLGGPDYILLIKGKMYECAPTPVTYDPNYYFNGEFQPSPPSYIVTCEDGNRRKYYAEHFMDIVEARQEKLKELGIK